MISEAENNVLVASQAEETGKYWKNPPKRWSHDLVKSLPFRNKSLVSQNYTKIDEVFTSCPTLLDF